MTYPARRTGKTGPVTPRLATDADLDFLRSHDTHVDPGEWAAIVARGRATVVGAPVGWLRWNLFWDEIPFLSMLYVLEPHRGTGLGGALLDQWEGAMAAAGHEAVLTSTRSDEGAQHLYRARGYADCGALLLPGEPTELLLRKVVGGAG